ncbi:MAG: rhomboid family intramembrane serine protease [Bacteroidota bacterium]
MFQSIWEDVKREFSYGNMVTQIIIVNTAVFVLMGLVGVFFVFTSENSEIATKSFIEFQQLFSISDSFLYNLTHPWVVFTHMFLHVGFLHILFNMLWFYWFGRIASDFLGNQRLLPIYLLGGLAGALAFFLTAQLDNLETGGYALGASAAVLAVITAAATTAPNYHINLLFLGAIKLKYIAGVFVLLDIIAIAQISSNTGGSIAHLGGAAFGSLFVVLLRQGTDLAAPVNTLIDHITNFFKALFSEKKSNSKSRKKPHVAYKNPNKKASQKRSSRRGRRNNSSDEGDLSHQEKVDAILDKIKRSGYESLSTAEKEYLFNASKQD